MLAFHTFYTLLSVWDFCFSVGLIIRFCEYRKKEKEKSLFWFKRRKEDIPECVILAKDKESALDRACNMLGYDKDFVLAFYDISLFGGN